MTCIQNAQTKTNNNQLQEGQKGFIVYVQVSSRGAHKCCYIVLSLVPQWHHPPRLGMNGEVHFP